MDAKTLFGQKLPQILKSSPDTARALDAIYVLKISGDNGGTWTVDLKSDPPSVSEGEAEPNDCVVELSDSDFEELLGDTSRGMQLFLEGKIQISNPMLATKLVDLLSL